MSATVFPTESRLEDTLDFDFEPAAPPSVMHPRAQEGTDGAPVTSHLSTHVSSEIFYDPENYSANGAVTHPKSVYNQDEIDWDPQSGEGADVEDEPAAPESYYHDEHYSAQAAPATTYEKLTTTEAQTEPAAQSLDFDGQATLYYEPEYEEADFEEDGTAHHPAIEEGEIIVHDAKIPSGNQEHDTASQEYYLGSYNGVPEETYQQYTGVEPVANPEASEYVEDDTTTEHVEVEAEAEATPVDESDESEEKVDWAGQAVDGQDAASHHDIPRIIAKFAGNHYFLFHDPTDNQQAYLLEDECFRAPIPDVFAALHDVLGGELQEHDEFVLQIEDLCLEITQIEAPTFHSVSIATFSGLYDKLAMNDNPPISNPLQITIRTKTAFSWRYQELLHGVSQGLGLSKLRRDTDLGQGSEYTCPITLNLNHPGDDNASNVEYEDGDEEDEDEDEDEEENEDEEDNGDDGDDDMEEDTTTEITGHVQNQSISPESGSSADVSVNNADNIPHNEDEDVGDDYYCANSGEQGAVEEDIDIDYTQSRAYDQYNEEAGQKQSVHDAVDDDQVVLDDAANGAAEGESLAEDLPTIFDVAGAAPEEGNVGSNNNIDWTNDDPFMDHVHEDTVDNAYMAAAESGTAAQLTVSTDNGIHLSIVEASAQPDELGDSEVASSPVNDISQVPDSNEINWDGDDDAIVSVVDTANINGKRQCPADFETDSSAGDVKRRRS